MMTYPRHQLVDSDLIRVLEDGYTNYSDPLDEHGRSVIATLVYSKARLSTYTTIIR